MKICPYCAEEIPDDEIVCRYCGLELTPPKTEKKDKKKKKKSKKKKKKKKDKAMKRAMALREERLERREQRWKKAFRTGGILLAIYAIYLVSQYSQGRISADSFTLDLILGGLTLFVIGTIAGYIFALIRV